MKKISITVLGLILLPALTWIVFRAALYGSTGGRIVYSEWAGDTNKLPDLHVTNVFGLLHPKLAGPASAGVWSPDGKQIVYECKPSSYSWNICLMNADGSEQKQLTFATGSVKYQYPSWSPNGETIVFEYETNLLKSELFVIQADGSGLAQITRNGYLNTNPAWSPDGRKIVFVLTQNNNSEIYMINADGSESTKIITSPSFDSEPIWSGDGNAIFFVSNRSGNFEIYSVKADGSGLINLTNSPLDESTPELSPDGQWIAFSADYPQAKGDGPINSDIFIMKTDGTEQKQLTNTLDFDYAPTWSPDGKSIAFISSRSGEEKWAVYVVKANGRWPTRITFGTSAAGVDWQP